MQEVGIDSSSKDDVDEFNKIVRPLKGQKASNPLDLCFIATSRVEDKVYYRFSRPAFDISESILRNGVVELLNADRGTEDLYERKPMEQLLYLSYGNASQTSRYKDQAREIVSFLVEHRQASKQDLMRQIDLDPRSESDDRKFRRTVQYLKGSWSSERKNPLHTENHGFLVSSRMEGNKSYYQLSPAEFKQAMNVVVKNIRGFIQSDPSNHVLQLQSE